MEEGRPSLIKTRSDSVVRSRSRYGPLSRKQLPRDPKAFVNITRSAWGIENGLMQNLLARGLAITASRMPNVALDFLCSDPRRFLLGHFRVGEQANSIALVAAVAPHLDEPGLQRLEAAILSWTRYWPDVELVDRQDVAQREARLRLLKAIPESLLTPTTAAFVRREQAELPEWDQKPYFGGHAGFVKEIPPLTKEQMIAATDEQILKTLGGDRDGDRSKQQWHEDEGGWVRPGGARAAVRTSRVSEGATGTRPAAASQHSHTATPT